MFAMHLMEIHSFLTFVFSPFLKNENKKTLHSCVCKPEDMRQSEDNLQELVLSSHHVRVKDRTQVIRIGGQCLYLLNRLEGLTFVLSCRFSMY